MAAEGNVLITTSLDVFSSAGTSGTRKTPAALAEIVSQFASSRGWIEKVRLCADRRWYERLHLGPDYDIWLISWLPGQSTGFHDHGESSGAFVVASGTLEEQRPGEQLSIILAGKAQAFGSGYAHDVRNNSLAPAISIHAYSPPLSEMNEYELHGSRLVRRQRSEEARGTVYPQWQKHAHHASNQSTTSGIDRMLAAARARLQRLSPVEAYSEAANNHAVFVDIRPERQRAGEGSLPGALTIERNVLEWRLDPACSARLPVAEDYGLRVIVFCSEGDTSSLAAASLLDLGLYRATDIMGGFRAWREAGVPAL
jgi:rhodanese-related sulfurtransferase